MWRVSVCRRESLSVVSASSSEPSGFAKRFGTKTVNGARRSRLSRCPSR